jgi:hypothetical protein
MCKRYPDCLPCVTRKIRFHQGHAADGYTGIKRWYDIDTAVYAMDRETWIAAAAARDRQGRFQPHPEPSGDAGFVDRTGDDIYARWLQPLPQPNFASTSSIRGGISAISIAIT